MEIEDIEGLNGRVQSVSSAGFTLQDSTSGQTFTINVDNNTQFQDFNQVGCAANNFSCVQVGQIVEVEHLLDRKSTRLNSSHQIISYAVFCLKKKKNAVQACASLSIIDSY